MSDITVNNFKAFYKQIRPYLGAVHSGFTPIGTVISVMGTTAPLNYLVCDGTVYNISDYSELAAYFNQQFGSSNFFGGDGTTTFAVPDLRGEFLRGTGTNSHTNQGSGANVGVHQDGTSIPNLYATTNNGYIQVTTDGTTIAAAKNVDSEVSGNIVISSFNTNPSLEEHGAYTSRPTNTSVLYCIASKNIFMDAGSNYSTEEQVVGTWIDGKPIYQKTITGSLHNSSTDLSISLLSNIEAVVDATGYIYDGNSKLYVPSNVVGTRSNGQFFEIWVVDGDMKIIYQGSWNFTSYVVTIQYTKTTD